MAATLPRATTRIVPTRAGIATGERLATIWGCVTDNADYTPRLWANGDDFEAFHGTGQLLDHLSTFIDLTNLPALVVPLPITTPGIIRWQRQAGTGTAAPTVFAAAPNGSLERVDGAVRIVRGGTVGIDQIQFEYSLDGGNFWRLVRLSTNTSYTIPRIGQLISFPAGTLVADETVLTWASTGPSMSDADIAAGLEKLKQQQQQSRGWFVIRDLEREQDASAIRTAANSYDTDALRPLQAHVGIRPARDRSGYKAQMSRTRSWMTGNPEITFAQGAGPPNDTINRDAGSFVADGFAGWSVGNGDWITVSGSSEAANNGSWKLSAADVLSLTLNVAGVLTSVVDAGGVSIWTTMGLEFVDGGGSDDELVRGRGSWTDEGFAVGDTITVSGTASNDGEYVILDVTTDTISVATGSFAAEEISSWDVTIVVPVSYPVDVALMSAEFAPEIGHYHLELGYGRSWYPSPVYGARLRYSAAFLDFARSFQRDLAETTWEQDVGAAAGWGFYDEAGLPFEYDEDYYKAALPAGFTCLRTWPNAEAGGVYVARGLTREDGAGPLTQSHYARVTNLARIVVQRTTQRYAGKVIVTKPANALGQKLPTAESLAKLATKVNAELTQNLGGQTRGGAGPRASLAVYTLDPNTDYAQQNPIQRGTLRLEVLGTIVELDTAVEVI